MPVQKEKYNKNSCPGRGFIPVFKNKVRKTPQESGKRNRKQSGQNRVFQLHFLDIISVEKQHGINGEQEQVQRWHMFFKVFA
jgi:hypothetical protein